MPLLAAQAIQRWFEAIRSDVAREAVGLMHWNKELPARFVCQLQVLALAAVQLSSDQTHEACDTVVHVNDWVTWS